MRNLVFLFSASWSFALREDLEGSGGSSLLRGTRPCSTSPAYGGSAHPCADEGHSGETYHHSPPNFVNSKI